ncbi:MAG: CPBP family intramembrane metalloprotease [Prevotellaceae bacterium]|jgi:membrane protease YdiL (CAAX protease family)|nr:CPBP family intramembrane metalloprotease [Prevotellaceae bacterium]
MTKILLEALLQILVLIPFAVIFLKEKTKVNFLRLLIFVFCYVVYQIFLVLPKINSAFDFIKSSWNWDGKILGIIFGIISCLLFKKYFRENDFFTLKQNKKNFKPALIGATVIVLLSTIVWFLLGKSEFNLETLAFQISLPGIDEEIMFRGILLGLLATSVKDKVSFLGNPGILLTAILFGFMHALTLDRNFSIDFDAAYFFQTGFAGYIWGWITIKSRSILLAILSHNFSNFFGTLSTMIK